MTRERRHNRHTRSLKGATNILINKIPNHIPDKDKLLDPLYSEISESEVSLCLPECITIEKDVCLATGKSPEFGKQCLAQEIVRTLDR